MTSLYFPYSYVRILRDDGRPPAWSQRYWAALIDHCAIGDFNLYWASDALILSGELEAEASLLLNRTLMNECLEGGSAAL